MMAAQVTVDVGVKLNVLEASINELKSILSKLEIDSSSFKKVSSLIDSMTDSMQKFQTQTSKAFTSQGQFDKAQGTLEKIEETLNRTQQAIKNIKFSDLKLDNSQLDNFKQLVSNLDEAKTAYSNFLSSLKNQATAGFDLKNLGINVSDMKGSLEEVQAAITRVIENANNKLIGLQNQFNNTKAKVKELTNSLAKDAQTSATGLPTDFDKYINSAGTGFKGGSVKGKQEVIQQLKEKFQLTPTEVESLVASNFQQIKAAFQEWAQHPNKLIPDNIFSAAVARLKSEANDFKSAITDTKTQISGLEQLQTNVDITFNTDTAQAELAQLKERLAQVEAELEKYKNAQVSAATSAPAMTSASNSIKNSLQGLVTQLEQTNVAFTQMQQRVQTLIGIKQAIVNFTGFNSVMNLVKTGVKEAASTIKELDTTMNAISIVTNMSTSDLWKQADAYSQMAQNYGVSISGAYQVSKIYYQQGLQTNDVLNLTNETLKLCKVSGLDYATSTDYMTTALRGFKMEMSEASTIVDVYSSLASTTAVSQGELAEAMSKTASSLESVGTTFQEASSMIATMVAVTRESATNIGSALKSIAARYGELTKSTDELATDADGQVVSFNKVDKALQSVGITMQTTDGQFRSFTDVITELTGKWDQLSSTQQRYIATQFAGNRQQSRFLALVSNGDMLQQNLNTANTSEGLGTAQALKAMDSLESKLAQLKTAYQQFYVTMGAENAWKAAVSGVTQFTNSLNTLPKLFDTIPVNAISVITSGATLITNLLLSLINRLGGILKTKIPNIVEEVGNAAKDKISQKATEAGEEASENLKNSLENGTKKIDLASNLDEKLTEAQNKVTAFREAVSNIYNISPNSSNYTTQIHNVIDKLYELKVITEDTANALKNMPAEQAAAKIETMASKAESAAGRLTWLKDNSEKLGSSLTNAGYAINLLANFLNKGDEASQKLSGSLMAVAGVAITAGAIIKGIGGTIPWMAIVTGVLTVINGISTIIETQEEKLERLKKKAEELSNIAKQVKADQQTLQTGYDKLKQLEAARYESAEAAQEYQTQVDNLANSFPELISGFDSAGNVIMTTKSLEEALAIARKKTAQATIDSLKAEKDKLEQEKKVSIGTVNSNAGTIEGSLPTSSIAPNYKQLEDYLPKGVETWSNAPQAMTSALSQEFKDLDSMFLNTSQSLQEMHNKINSLKTDNLSQRQQEVITAVEEFLNDPLTIIENFLANIRSYDFTTSAGQEAYNQFKDAWRTWWNQLDEEMQRGLQGYSELVNNMSNEIQDIIFSDLAINNTGVALISAYMQLDDSLGDTYSWIEKETNTALMIANYISKQFSAQSQTGIKDDKVYYQTKGKQIVEQFNALRSNLSEETQKWLNDASTTAYTAEQILKVLKQDLDSKNIEYNADELENIIKSTYDTSEKALSKVGDNFELINKRIQNLQADDNNSKILEGVIKDFNTYETIIQDVILANSTDLTSDAASLINSKTNEIADLISKGMYSQAESLMNTYILLIHSIYNRGYNATEQAALVNILSSANLNTIEGINAAIQEIQSSTDIGERAKADTIRTLEAQISKVQQSVVSVYDASLDEILALMEEDEKIISKMASGMSISEADTLIARAKSIGLENWNIGDEIIQNGNKFIVTAQGIRDFYNNYSQNLSDNFKEAETAYNNMKNVTLELTGEDFDFTTDIDAAATALADKYMAGLEAGNQEIIEFIEQQGIEVDTSRWDTIKASFKEWIESVNTAKNNAIETSNSVLYAMMQEDLWKIGEYTDIWKDVEGNFDQFSMELDLSGLSDTSQLSENAKSAITKIQSGINNLVSDYISKAGDIDWSSYTNSGIESHLLEEMKNFEGSYEEFIDRFATLAGKTREEVDSLRAQAHNLDYSQKVYNALSGIVSDYTNFSYDLALNLATALGKTIEDLQSEGTIDIDEVSGTVTTNYEKLKAYLITHMEEMTTEQYNTLRAQLENAKTTEDNKVSSAVNEIVKNRNTVTNEQIASLATSLGKNFIAVKKMLKASQNADGTYNVDLSTIQALIESGELEVNKETANLIANQIDNTISSISDLFSNQAKGTTSFEAMQKAVNEINKTLGTDYDVSALYSYNEELKAYQLNNVGFMASLATLQAQLANASETEAKIIQQTINNELDNLASNIDVSGFVNAIGTSGNDFIKIKDNLVQSMLNYNNAVQQFGNRNVLSIGNIIVALEKGGDEAVKAAEAVAQAQGKTLTAEEISSVYRSAVERLNTTAEQVVSSVGTIIDETAAELINKYGGSATEIGDSGKYLIQEVGNLEAIYADLIKQMSNTAGATAEDIKNLTSKVKSYNDTLISQHREVEKTITDEINSLGSAKGGDWLNITQLWSTLQSKLENQVLNITDAAGAPIQLTAFDLLKSKLEEYGATLDDGILKLDSDANIAGVITTLTNYAQEYGNLLQSDVAQLADTLDEVLKSFASSIETALSGSLTKSGAVDLTNMVKSLGLDNVQLDFTETVNGLKLSYQSAEKLCIELKKANNEAGQLVFDKVYNSLVSTSGEFSTIQQTTMKIKDTQEQIENIDKQIQVHLGDMEGKLGASEAWEEKRVAALQKQKANLQDQLSLYDQIKKKQANDASSYNFMGNSTPSYMDGVTNYWNSVGTAFKSMNSAASTGYMSIQDFRNIINEMNSLAASTGQTLEFMGKELNGSSKAAADLINEGMNYLENVDGEGVKVNLKNFGVDISAGADSMQSGFQEGIKTMAEQQVALLDAAIQMLEVIVQMEALGDIDVDSNGVFSIGDVFKLDAQGNLTEEYTAEVRSWAADVLEAANSNEDLKAALDNFSINGISLRDMLENAKKGIYDLDISQEAYFAALEGLVKAAQSGDYSESALDSVWEVIKNSIPNGETTYTLDNGNVTIVVNDQTKYAIDWQKQSNQDLIEIAKQGKEITDKEARTLITEGIKRAESGEAETVVDTQYALTANPNVKFTLNKDGTVTYNGKTYKDGAAVILATQKAALEQAGLTQEEINKSTTTGYDTNLTMHTSTKVGNTEIQIEVDKDGNVWYLDDQGGKHKTENEAKSAIIEKILENNERYQTGSEEIRKEIRGRTYKAIFDYNPEIEFKAETEPTTNATEAALNIQNAGSEKLKEEIDKLEPDPVTGEVTLNYEGVTFTGDKATLQEKVENWASEETQGIDTTMANSITTALTSQSVIDAVATAVSQGISTAFSSGFNSTKNQNNTDVQGAAEGAATAAATDAAEAVQNTEFSIPAITVKTNSITIDTSSASTPTLSGTDATDSVPIENVTLNVTGGVTINVGADSTPTVDKTDYEVENLTLTGTNTGVTLNTNSEEEPTVDKTDYEKDGMGLTGTNTGVSLETEGSTPTIDKTDFTLDDAISATAALMNLTLGTDSTTIVNKFLSLPADQQLSVINAAAKVLLMSLETKDSTINPLTSNLASLPADQQLAIKNAIAVIQSIDPNTATATFGDITYTIPEEKKTFKVSDIFTALIQTINAQTISGEGGTDITLPESIDVGGKTIPITQALAIIQSVTAQLGQGVVPNYNGVIPEGDIEIHKNIVIVADNVSLDASNGGSVDLGTMNDELIAQANQAGVTADKVNTLNEKYNALADAMVNVEKTGGSEESLEGLTSAVTEYGTALDDVKDSVTNFDMTGDVASSVESAKTAIASTVEALGGSIPEGFATAVEAGKGEIDTAVSTAVQDVPQDINDVVDMGSPSHMAQEYGESVPEGFALGVNNGASEVDTAITTMVSGVPTEISTTINSINWSGMGSQVSSNLASGLSSNQESVASAAKSLVTAVAENLDFSNVSTSIKALDVKSIDKAKYDKILVLEDIKEGKANIKNLSVGANSVTANKSLSSLQNMDFSATSSSLSGVRGNLDKISSTSFTNFDSLRDKLVTATSQAQTLWDVVQKFANQTFTVNLNQTGSAETTKNSTENKTVNETKNVTETKTVNNISNTTVNVDTSSAQNSAKQLATILSSTLGPALSVARTKINLLASEIGSIPSKATLVATLATAMSQIPNGKAAQVSALASQMERIPDVGSRISNIVSALKNVPSGSKSLSVQLRYSVSKAGATGNIGGFAHAKGKSEALAKGRKTLMGELGPELVVSNGRYFVVGQNGAEFVNLAKDAIVFNHKQTKRLMEQGAIGSRGRALTNEANAISLAKGRLPYEEGQARVKDQNGGMSTQEQGSTTQKTKTVTETIRSVSISPSQSEQIKLYSFAKGNMGGPAMASASAALAALKEIREAWKALSSASAKTLGSAAGKKSGSGSGSGSGGSGSGGSGSGGSGSGGSGSGSGSSGKGSGGSGGGSGSSKEQTVVQFKTVTEEIERWYNLTRQIDALEKEITYQQSLRSKYESDMVANGERVYNTYKKELELLQRETDSQKELVKLQKSFYDAKRKELENSNYGNIFTYDENGLQQYVSNEPGSKKGLDILEELTRRDAATNKPLNNAETAIKQLDYLESVGFILDELLYKDDGTKVSEKAHDYKNIMVDSNGNVTTNRNKKDEGKTQEKRNNIAVEMMENFWDHLDGWKDELDSLWDSYQESLNKIEENQTKQNEILQKIVDNELSVEQEILKAIENRRQSEIDALTETKDAIKKTGESFTTGLSEQLERERNMYSKNQETNDLTKLQRQLAILERSGGSASQIKSLQDQIDSQLQENYFNKQQEQIDAIKEANDKQIEQLEKQVELMSESLEYDKANGLLWAEVRDIMKLSTNEIMSEIIQWNSEYKQKSDLDLDKTLREVEEKVQIWDSDRGASHSLKAFQDKFDEIMDWQVTDANDRSVIAQAYTTAYTKAAARGEASPEAAAIEFANKTAQGLGYHYMDDTTNAATEAYKANLTNVNLPDSFKESMGSVYEEEYDKAYAKEFANAYKQKLTGTGEGEFGLSDITEASSQQQEEALAYAKGVAEQKANTTATTQAENKQTSMEKAEKDKAKQETEKTGAYAKAAASLGDNFVNAYIKANAEKAFDDSYNKAREEGNTVEEALEKGSAALQNAVPAGNAWAGANLSKKMKIGSKSLKKGTAVSIRGIRGGGTQVFAVYTKGKKTYSGWYGSGNFYNLTDGEKIRLPRYKEGGLIDYTGPAIVDGSKSNPESILTAEQTRFLREDLLGNSKTSLKSIVSALQETMNNTAVSSVNTSNNVTIENISLTFEAGTITNDYDARRAGSNIADEIMRIARKAGANTITRR